MTETVQDRAKALSPHLSPENPIRFEPSPRRVRAVLGGVAIADSTHMKLLHEHGHLPVYYFPMSDVRMDLLEPTDHHTHCSRKGEASYWTVRVGDQVARNAVWGYQQPLEGREYLKGHVAFYWNKMDAWFEEDDEVFVHPRDPYKRVDVLHSSRHVQVVLGDQVVADTRRARLLFETGLPTRYYIPKLDVRMDLLTPTETRTRCPYKGEAVYWTASVGAIEYRDIVWSYPAPIPECPKIEGLMCFFNEKVDAIVVDGEPVEVPVTPWSHRSP